MDLLVPASFSGFLPKRVVSEGTFDEEVGTEPEQVLARASGSTRAGDDFRCPS